MSVPAEALVRSGVRSYARSLTTYFVDSNGAEDNPFPAQASALAQLSSHTHVSSPWASGHAFMVRLHSFITPTFERQRRYSCRLYSFANENRLVWESAVFLTALSPAVSLLGSRFDPRPRIQIINADVLNRTAQLLMPRPAHSFAAGVGTPDALARDVRELSGLTTESLGALFPVARESYQRWVSGKSAPAEHDLRRLLALRHLFAELHGRVANPLHWVLSPKDRHGQTPYDLLKSGRLTDVWDLVIDLPTAGTHEIARNEAGETILRLTRSARMASSDSRLDEADIDDLSDVDADEDD